MQSRKKRNKRPKPATGATAQQPPVIQNLERTAIRWRDHPVIVAAIACAAGAGATATFYEKGLIPLQSMKLVNEVDRLSNVVTKQKFQLQKSSDALEKSAKELTGASDSLKLFRAQLLETRFNDVFSPTNPYPNFARKIQLGSPIDSIDSNYPASQIEKPEDGGYVSVEFEDAPFSRITYYYDTNDKAKKITQILLHYDLNGLVNDKDALEDMVVSAFGQPDIVGKRDFKAWFVNREANLVKDSSFTLMIYPTSVVPPGYEPQDKKEPEKKAR